MRLRAWAALLWLSAGLQAGGGSPVTWLGGTLPYDTVPHWEADPKLIWSAGSGAPVVGAALDLGLTDWWMLQGDWSKPLDAAASSGRALTRLKLSPSDIGGFTAAAFGGYDLSETRGPDAFVGGIAGWESLEVSVILNAAYYPAMPGTSLSVGIWGPYAAYFIRPGFEWGQRGLGSVPQDWILPQVALNLGGDLSLDLGARFELGGAREWRVLTRLSYQLFPNP